MFGELMKWNPSQELFSWHRDIDDLFSRFFERPQASLGGYVPRIETFRKDNEYVVRLDLPGVDPKDVHRLISGRPCSGGRSARAAAEFKLHAGPKRKAALRAASAQPVT